MGDLVSIGQVARLVDERESSPVHYRRALVLADSAIPLITVMAKAYTRDRGFTDGEPNAEIAAVITTASARMASNTAQTSTSRTESGEGGSVTREQRSWFTGWTLAEQMVLNRYRKRAM